MGNRKQIRTRGKLKLSRYFQNLKNGDSVAVISEISLNPQFPKRLQGRTGKVKRKMGKSYVINIKDQDRKKEFIIKSIHLKKIENIN